MDEAKIVTATLPDGTKVDVKLPVDTSVAERLTRIEERLDNHITHFGERLNSLDKKFWALILIALSSLAAALLR